MYESLELAHISGITLFAKKTGERLPYHHVIRFGSTRSLHPLELPVHRKSENQNKAAVTFGGGGGCQNVAVLHLRKLQGTG